MEWDFWTSSNDGCGNACDRQSEFKIAMRETAQSLQKVIVLPPTLQNGARCSAAMITCQQFVHARRCRLRTASVVAFAFRGREYL